MEQMVFLPCQSEACHTHPQLTNTTYWPHPATAQAAQDHLDHTNFPPLMGTIYLAIYTHMHTNLFRDFI